MTKKVLIADDNIKNRFILKDILIFNHYEVLEAENGEQAVAITKSQNPDVILMDIQMPLMDGFEALKQIRSDPKTAATIVIAVTSSAMEGDREKILKSDFNDYVSKPFDFKELINLINRYIGKPD